MMQLRLSINQVFLAFLAVILLAGASVRGEESTGRAALPEGFGVLVVAHGGNAAWNEAVERTVAPLRDEYPIEIAYGMARRSTIVAAVERLERQGVTRIAVVRMFISGKSFLPATEVIFGLRPPAPGSAPHDHEAGMAPSEMDGAGHHQGHGNDHRGHDHSDAGGDDHGNSGHGHHMQPPRPIALDADVALSAAGVAESPLVDVILADRIQNLSLDPSREAVLVLAHGPGDDAENERWLASMRARVAMIAELGDFASIECMTLREDWPEARAEAEARIRSYVHSHHEAGRRVLVVPFRVAGFGPYREALDGLTYTADGVGFCPHPLMTRWLDETARTLAMQFELRSASH